MDVAVVNENQCRQHGGYLRYRSLSDGELLDSGRCLSRELGEVLSEAARRKGNDLVEAVLRLFYDEPLPENRPTVSRDAHQVEEM